MVELETARPFFADRRELLEEILGRYPAYGRRSALMPLLWEVQRAERYVSESRVAEIADILDLHPTEVRGVMSFYSTYHDHPVGRYHLQVCSTLACSLAGSDELYDYLTDQLGIVNGETDDEGRFSLQKVECLGSCTSGPVLQVNDTYYERLGRSRCAGLLDALRRDEMPAPWRERGGDAAGPSDRDAGANAPSDRNAGADAPSDRNAGANAAGPSDPSDGADAGGPSGGTGGEPPTPGGGAGDETGRRAVTRREVDG